ncbi:DUF445 domain-containing protein [Myroides pelagicus]|uniref:DUF445 family protein n=1 Tax=Myroides pelagicus TaxID=270914 RepID=A0A7K1GMA1_9FLAO|nr:DUF445 domain-containing protein [Myroides pelagicus]MEC4113113.1 DUF445 domain-containing protein [Myroides pelagicus]MTH30015.1 DUF445 family protein [Myroides pelagicus]
MKEKKKQLQKHKRIATGLFLLMAIVYIAMVYWIKHSPTDWMGYVKAFSEAAMVGALADWFAVTALFRQPMGLPIPHTNLIVNSKNKIGDNLGGFVTDNFLTAENIRPYIDKIDLAAFVSTWITAPTNQKVVERECVALAQKIVDNLDDTTVIQFFTNKAQQGIASINIQSFVAQGLMYAVEKGEHQRLLDVVLPKAQLYIEENREEIYQAVIAKKPLLGLVGGKAVTNQLIGGIHTFLEDIATNPTHKLRTEITTRLEILAAEIATQEQWKTKFEEILNQFITPEKIQGYISEFWQTTKNSLNEQLQTEDSTLRNYIQTNIQRIADNLQEDEELQQKINRWVKHAVYKAALKNTKEVGTLIRQTVNRWDGRELSDKLELEVGKDLQFIRINGTLVGGLVGLLIYIITHLLL